MALTEIINEDLKSAMKSGDSIKLNTIRSIRAQIIELSKRGTGISITPEEEMTILLGAAKKRKEAIELYLECEGDKPKEHVDIVGLQFVEVSAE